VYKLVMKGYKLVKNGEVPDEAVLFYDINTGNLEGVVLRATKVLPLGGDCIQTVVDAVSGNDFSALLNCDNITLPTDNSPFNKSAREACFTRENNRIFGTKIQNFPVSNGAVQLNHNNDLWLGLFNTHPTYATLTIHSRTVSKRVRFAGGWNKVKLHLGPFPGRHRLTIAVRRGGRTVTFQKTVQVLK
jgi:hypothetical protein